MSEMKHRPRAVTEVDRALGERLRFYRLLNQLSQEALAERVGLTFQQVQKYENGANRISVSRLIAFSSVLGVSVGEFVEGVGPEAQECGLVSAIMASPDCSELLRLLIGAERGKQRLMVRVARVVAESRSEVLEAAE